MEKKEFIKKLAINVAIVAAIVIALIGVCFGKRIETTLFGEISKWIVVGIGIIGILEGFIAMGVGGIIYHFWYEKRKPRLDQE